MGTDGEEYIDGRDGSDIIDAGAGNDTLVYDAADTLLDGGADFDTIVLSDGINLDFSDETIDTVINNIEKIDMTDNGSHTISNLSLDDILDMTATDSDGINSLTISGDLGDKVINLDTTSNGWTEVDGADSDFSDGKSYTNDSGDSITLTVDEQIDTTGI